MVGGVDTYINKYLKRTMREETGTIFESEVIYMLPQQGFGNKTRVIKTKGYGKGRRGLVKEVDFMAGIWIVVFDDTLLAEKANPYEYEPEPRDATRN